MRNQGRDPTLVELRAVQPGAPPGAAIKRLQSVAAGLPSELGGARQPGAGRTHSRSITLLTSSVSMVVSV